MTISVVISKTVFRILLVSGFLSLNQRGRAPITPQSIWRTGCFLIWAVSLLSTSSVGCAPGRSTDTGRSPSRSVRQLHNAPAARLWLPTDTTPRPRSSGVTE